MQVLKRVGVFSAAKVTGVLTAVFGLIPGVVFAFIGGGLGSFGGELDWLVNLVGFPIVYGLAGVVFGAIYAALYNGVARLVGGIEIELE